MATEQLPRRADVGSKSRRMQPATAKKAKMPPVQQAPPQQQVQQQPDAAGIAQQILARRGGY